MELTIARNYDFIPEWNGNRADPKPVTLHNRMLTTGEREKLLKYEFGVDGDVRLIPDRPGLFTSAVVSVDNLVVNGEAVKTARDFLGKPGLDVMFAEAVADIIGQNMRGEPKN